MMVQILRRDKMDKNLSLRWQCKLCKSRIYIIKTVDGDDLECPTCKAVMFSQVEERGVE
jgi:hypothetical protein